MQHPPYTDSLLCSHDLESESSVIESSSFSSY
jgi:hypothetical protein